MLLLGKDSLWLSGTRLPLVGEVFADADADDALLSRALHAGRIGDDDFFVISAETAELPQLASDNWLPWRQALALLDASLFAMLGRAIQLQHWLTEHRFCSRCGTVCTRHERDYAMCCPACSYLQYPRINPCMIVLITKGEKALLAQGARFPAGLFSCLAGFIEAGESAEQAVRREVREEVGLELGELRYHGSQSWPFPHSLMLGFRAEWQSGDICPDADEIVAADWFDRQSLPRLPTSGSIARELIDAWLNNT